jgi:hypothetical protein
LSAYEVCVGLCCQMSFRDVGERIQRPEKPASGHLRTELLSERFQSTLGS